MKQLVLISGGFHPFHPGHLSLYRAAKETFPSADVVVAATNDTSERPFPFRIKQKLAQVSGVPPRDFVEVSRQFNAMEPAIASRIKNINDTVLIFVRSDKDKNKPPLPAALDPATGQLPLAKRGPNKGQPVSDYLQYLAGNEDNIQPMTQHAYMAYLPTEEFGPGMTSASEIRKEWPTLDQDGKIDRVMSLYPATQSNPALANNVVKMLDTAMGAVDESVLGNLPRPNKRNQFKSLHRLRKQRGLDEQGVAEATGDERFDSMMGQIQREPPIPDPQMPPTDVKDLYQWAVKNNKPYHKIFAEWANREGYKSVAPALQKAGNLDTDALDYWTPKVWKIYWGEVHGIDSEMPDHWRKERVPDELRDYLETVFDAYENIWQDWPTEYRQIGQQGVAEASDRMQRYGQLILKRAQAARDAEPEPKKQQPPALNSISTRELMQQLKKPKNKNVAAAPDYMEENIKRE